MKSLEVEGYKLEPKFKRQNSNYTIYTKSNTSKLKIKAEADDEKAKVEGIGEIEINQSENSINVHVTAENGHLKVYTITIDREKNMNIINKKYFIRKYCSSNNYNSNNSNKKKKVI